MEDEDIRYFHEKYTQAELEQWFGQLLEKYYPWAEFYVSWKKCRNESMQGLEFPFSYREGQRGDRKQRLSDYPAEKGVVRTGAYRGGKDDVSRFSRSPGNG